MRSATATSLAPGIVLALVSAAAFSWSGPLGQVLYGHGWSTGAVVNLRIWGAALLLGGPAVLLLLRHRSRARAWTRTAVIYGLVAMAGIQVCFFLSVVTLSPALALAWTWLRTGRRPATPVLVGAALGVGGLVLILGLGSGTPDAAGVAWALAGGVCQAAYFHLGKVPDQPPHVVMVGVGYLAAALAVGTLAVTGLLPVRVLPPAASAAEPSVPWWVAGVALVVVAGVISYVTGVAAITAMGSRRASFFGLTEVLFAALWTFVLEAVAPGALAFAGMVIVLVGVALVQVGSGAEVSEPLG